jgi:hypothetical protein
MKTKFGKPVKVTQKELKQNLVYQYLLKHESKDDLVAAIIRSLYDRDLNSLYKQAKEYLKSGGVL